MRSNMMFRQELIYIFDLTVNQMKRINSTSMNNYIETTKFSRNPVVSTPLNLNSFQRKSINTLNYASKGKQLCVLFISHQ